MFIKESNRFQKAIKAIEIRAVSKSLATKWRNYVSPKEACQMSNYGNNLVKEKIKFVA